MSSSNIQVEPSTATWANQNLTEVTAVADSSGSLDATYITFSSPTADFYAWIDVDNGSVDPAPAGKTGIEVDISSDDTAATVAAACVTAIDANANFHCKIDPDDSTKFIIQNVDTGAATATADGGAATGFTIATGITGASDDLGEIEGDIVANFEEQFVDITTHQNGTEVIDAIRTGSNVEVTLTFKETTVAALTKVFSPGGGTVTVSTDVLGWGTNKQFTSMCDDARALILHPAANSSSDYSEDKVFWLAYPMVDTLTISGENPNNVSATFKVFRNKYLNTTVSKVAIGDWTQKLLK